jgi:hypothetical protein
LYPFGISLLFCFFSILVVFCGFGTGVFSAFLSIVYPIYASLEALAPSDARKDAEEKYRAYLVANASRRRKPHSGDSAAPGEAAATGAAAVEPPLPLSQPQLSLELLSLRHCLVYWLISSLFSAFELVFDRLLSWLPLYFPFKFVFLLWCFLPAYHGANTIFDHWLAPLLQRHSALIEEGIATTQTIASDTVTHLGRTVRANSAKLTDLIVAKGMELYRQASNGINSQSSTPRSALPAKSAAERAGGIPSVAEKDENAAILQEDTEAEPGREGEGRVM